MNEETDQKKQALATLVGDFWGGLAGMLVALPSSIAYGVLVYTALGPEYAGQGAMTGILGAAAIGIFAPFIGRTAGLISAPCAPAAAVLAALIGGLLAGKGGVVVTREQILPLLALTAFFAALLQIAFGLIGGGRLIKYIPYPVVSGYLSGVAILIALGQLPKLFGLPKGTPLLQGLMSPGLWKWQGLAVGVFTIAVMGIAPRLTKKVPAAILGLAGGMTAYFGIGFFFPPMLTLQENPLVIGAIPLAGSFFDMFASRSASLFQIDTGMISLIFIPALTLSALLSIDTLKTCVVLDAMTRGRHDSNRELIGQGVGNLAAFLTGGMAGAGSMGPSLVNVASGGKTARSGIIEGALVILALLLLHNAIAWVPIGALSGILLMVAWRMFDRSIFHLLRYPMGRMDFAVIAGVILVALTVDLIAASGVGVGLSILLFTRDQMKGAVIRQKRYLNQISSKTRRLAAEREILDKHGDQGIFCELQGNLFFGTTDKLYTQLEPDLRTKRYLLLDMRHVLSMDYTAAHLFEQMHARLSERNGQLLFSGMPSAILDQRNFEKYLTQLGVVREGKGIIIAETLDSALEWIEDRLLEDAGATPRSEVHLYSPRDFDLFRGFDDATISALSGCMTEKQVPAGDKVFSQGDAGDELFLVRRGSVRILLPLEGGKRHHLATVGRGDFFGELSFLDYGARSADVEAKVTTDLYVLSRSRLNEFSRTDAATGVQIFARLALAIAGRLRHTDSDIQMLEER